MNAFAKILVAVDESPASQAALTEAITLAQATSAELVLAHVTSLLGERYVRNGHKPNRVPDMRTPALATSVARAEHTGVPVRAELLIGYPPKQLALVADDVDAELIVIGSRHLRGLKRAMLGSTSRELLGESNRPIMIVPAPAADRATSAA